MIGKKIENIKLVVSGAGAAAISCARFYVGLGCAWKTSSMCDIEGVNQTGTARGLLKSTKCFATNKDIRHISEAMIGGRCILGLSAGNIISQDQVRTMADNPIVFCPGKSHFRKSVMKKPWLPVRDIIMATGRS